MLHIQRQREHKTKRARNPEHPELIEEVQPEQLTHQPSITVVASVPAGQDGL